jgi:hypothetical protein
LFSVVPLIASPMASFNFFAAGPASPLSQYTNFLPVSSFVMLEMGRTDTDEVSIRCKREDREKTYLQFRQQ